MLAYWLGIPGSGKTYASVNVIYNNFTDNKDAKKDIKKEYVNCYTNINEFNFSLTNDVFKLDFDDLVSKLEILHQLYKVKEPDSVLIEKAKELDIYRSFFVIDEAHNHFDIAKPVLVWWLTYHRHLYHDIYLITQNLSLINAKFKPLAEAFYKAKPMSLTLNKKFFNYIYYTDKGLTNASKVGVNKVLKRDGVFKLYTSGDSVESENVVLKFIKIAVAFAFILFAIGYFFYYEKTEEINSKKISKYSPVFENNVPNEVEVEDEEKELNDESQRLVVFNCDNYSCSYKNIQFSVYVLKFAQDRYEIEKISSIKRFHRMEMTYSVSSDFLNFIEKENNNDESDIDEGIKPITSSLF